MLIELPMKTIIVKLYHLSWDLTYIFNFGFSNVGHLQRAARKGSTECCESMVLSFSSLLSRLPFCFNVLNVFNCFSQVYVANLRLKEVNTDMLVIGYEPIHIK